MLSRGILLLVLSFAQFAAADSPSVESPRLASLAAAIESGDAAALGAFWNAIERVHTPLIETPSADSREILVTFLWRAAPGEDALNVGVLSPLGETYRAHAVPEALGRLAATDVWYRTYRTSNQTRFEYSLAWPQGRDPHAAANDSLRHHGITYELFQDPRNPRAMPSQWDEKDGKGAWVDKVRRVSYAEGPAAAAEPFVAERSGIRRGKLTTFEFKSELLGNSRRLSIYTPPGFDRGHARCDFLLLFDRAEYLMAVPTPVILDNMQADGVIRPIVAVFVGNAPGARSEELPGNAKFQAFLRQELLPWVRARYRFTTDPARSVVGGSSYGGLASAFAALTFPDVFGNVLSQSGSYWWWPGFRYQGRDVEALSSDAGWMIRQYSGSPRLPLRFYLEAGTLEGPLMLLPNRMFRDVLQAKGYEVTYREFTGAHDYVMWRSTISEGLVTLIGTRRSPHQ